jgi:putative thioredoxin
MADSPFIIEVTADNFDQVVLEGSQQQPVLVDFWADWCGPCKALMPILAKLAEEYRGKFILAKVNSDENQALAQQYGIRSLPTVKLFKHGAAVDEFMGALPEGQVREFLDQHIERESDAICNAALAAEAAGDPDKALELLKTANEVDPGRPQIVAALARLLMQKGEADTAEALLNALPTADQESREIAALLAQLEFSREGGIEESAESLQSQLEASPDNLELRYRLALRLLADKQYEAAMQHLLAIMQKDRSFGDDAARKTLLKAFDMLGDDPLVAIYRRKMFNFLY